MNELKNKNPPFWDEKAWGNTGKFWNNLIEEMIKMDPSSCEEILPKGIVVEIKRRKGENKMNELEKQNTSMTLVERLKARTVALGNKVLILDMSGSMHSDVEPGLSKIQALKDIVSSISGNPSIIVFNSSAHVADKNSIGEPTGNTYMAEAFQLAKDQGFKSALLITDGIANDPTEALIEAVGLNIQIMYVGAGNKPKFLDDLAAQSGGFCTKENLKLDAQKELSTKIQLLLGDGKEETKKGPICL